MATLLGSIRTRVRTQLNEASASYWTDAELGDHIIAGILDMWGAITDLHQEHYFTVDETNVSMASNTATLTGVPADTFRVLLIEPRDTSSANAARNVLFVPRDYNSYEFSAARSLDNQDPTGSATIYYQLSQAGAPVAAPTVHVAPKLTSALNLRFVYIPTIPASAYNDFTTDNNPIPGEADNALFAWGMAYARAKERDDGSPDPNWLAVYATEKQNVLTRLTPRQEQEPEYVRGFMDGFPDYYY